MTISISIFILLALCGLVIGILSGIFGVGGGLMMVPLLHLIMRLPMLASSATSLFVVAPTSISGAYRHLRQGRVDVKASLILGLSGACASSFSAMFSDNIPEYLIIALTVSILAYSAITIIRNALKPPIDEEGRTSENRFKTPLSLTLARIGIGVFAGLVAGIAGVGGGFIMVPLGVAYFGYLFKESTAISLLAVCIIAIPGIITHAVLGHVWYLYGLALMVGTIPGANIGVRIVSKIPEKAARFAFAGLLIFSGIMLVANRLVFGF